VTTALSDQSIGGGDESSGDFIGDGGVGFDLSDPISVVDEDPLFIRDGSDLGSSVDP